ncbi:protein GVQW3-like [Rhodnius prolixus]|uniref:protein GVQW3-like n=1 Tax=Rhodnius prolixus TaxID=13249 RepID=UPI003D188AA2
MQSNFAFALEKSGASTLEMIHQAYGRKSLSQAQIFRWHKMFKEGRGRAWRTSPCAGRPPTSQEPQKTNRRLSVRMIVEQLGMDKMVVHKIISEDLGMRKICAKLVPKVLTDVQKAKP